MVILELVERVGRVAEGNVVTVPLASPGEQSLVAAWCERTGNTLVSADDRVAIVQRGRVTDPIARLSADRVPGAMLRSSVTETT